MERGAGLEVARPASKDFLRTLENGLRFGRPVRGAGARTHTQPSPH